MKQLTEYEKAAEIMPGSVIIFQLRDDDTVKILFHSKKVEEVTGLSSAELEAMYAADGLVMALEVDRKKMVEKARYAIAHNEEFDIVYRQNNIKTAMRWIHMKAGIVGEQDGLPVFLAGLLDVTNEMLSSSCVMEATDRCICVIEKDTKLLLYGNARFFDLIHKEPGQGVGAPCYESLCGNPELGSDGQCLCFCTVNRAEPFEYYNPKTKQYLSMYGREILWGDHEAYVFFITDQTEEKFKDKQLKNAQERFDMTLENSGLYIWEYDIINSQCINPQKAVQEYGLPPVIDNYPEALYEMGHTPPETIAQIKEAKKRLLNGETGFSMERCTVNKDGKTQWMKVSYRLELDPNGNPARALVCGIDITEQKKKELEYQKELRMKTTVANDTTILAVLNLTKDTVLESDSNNTNLKPYLKLGSVDKIGRAVCEDFVAGPDKEKYLWKFSRKKMLSDYEHGVMHGSFRHQFAHRVGWFESAYDLLVNPSTGDVEAVTSIKDITEEVRSQQIISKLAAIDYDLIFTIDVETGDVYGYDGIGSMQAGRGRYMSAQEYKAYKQKEVFGHCTPDEAKRLAEKAELGYVLKKLEISSVYTRMYTMSAGKKAMHKRYIYTYLDASHRTVLCARQDVTETYLQEEKQKNELSLALEKAEVANRAKTAFLSRVSHDMRTPLNGILGLTNLMQDETVQPEVLNDLKQLKLSGKYLLDLINDVLDVSSIESGKLELRPVACDPHLLMDTVIKLAKLGMEEKGINFVVEADNLQMVPVYVDEARLQQVAMNLLGNAQKFTPTGGEVEFICHTVSVENGIVRNEFLIRDNGIGMKEEFVPHLFEPFVQENAATTNSKNGTGLGMSITKKIVELMNGTIQVESKKDVGTTVRVLLDFPIATEEQIRQSKAAAQPCAFEYHLEGCKVLLCEDHPLNREIAIRILKKAGMVVENAENGAIAVEKFAQSEEGYYDAILMDIRMPVMDGLDAARAIRGLGRADAATVPILAMTANALDDDVKNSIDAGMNAHLSKPIDPSQLYQNLDKYIKEKRTDGRAKLLVVDDNETNRAVLVAALQKNYHVYEAQNGMEAMELLQNCKGIRLVITDVQMPGMDGIELVRAIRSNENYHHIAVVAYTQREEGRQEEMLLQMGVNDFIYKPLNPHVVELRIKNALSTLY